MTDDWKALDGQPSEKHRIGYRVRLDDERSVMVCRIDVRRTSTDGTPYVEYDVAFIEFVSEGGETTRLILSGEATEALHGLIDPDGYAGDCTLEWIDLDKHAETASYGLKIPRPDVCPAPETSDPEAEAGGLSGGEGTLPEVRREDQPGADDR